ncbi:MAG: 23S rRNA (uracil(1939)-C(5))-methyltransferase RlmD [Clostridia bacterium]|nr:23S rRNA (uracil(1939)-C(5))-methyltransferase RlmD [Clostridia bacterium]
MFKCKYSSRCGGCDGAKRTIETELKEKTQYIKDLFSNYDCQIPDCRGEYYPLKYRNKIHLAFGELKGKTIIGFFEEGSSKITDVDDCLLYDKWASVLISILREYISRFKIRPYNKMGYGIIRYAHARCISNKIQLTLVVSTDNFPGRDWLYHKLTEKFSEVSLYLNINRRTDHAVFDKTFKFVKGNKFLNFEMCGVKVSLSPSSFLQVNLSVAEKMYKSAMQMLDINQDTTVVDLYSGIGITSVMFSKSAKQVISIEEVVSAVDNAKFMAKLNDRNNIVHFCGKCEKEIGKLKIDGDAVVFVDPARAGLEKSVIDAIIKFNPRKIVYMSCNPETCVRDIDVITNGSMYKVSEISAWNMFPYTKHIETLVCLQRQV